MVTGIDLDDAREERDREIASNYASVLDQFLR
jgi:hypothetical protein